MKKYCVNEGSKVLYDAKENRGLYKEKIDSYKTSTPYIRECLKEYSLEDKINALKNILVHNEKHIEKPPSQKKDMCKMKKMIGVKECLQPIQETPFQTIMSELKNTVMNSYWNKEVGKTRYQIPNLPVGMDPLTVTFGKKNISGETMAEVLQRKQEETKDSEAKILEMYKKSHNRYLPAEQAKRDYNKPFDESLCFGKWSNADYKGLRTKKRLAWFNTDLNTIVNSNLADFIERTHSQVGEVKNLKNASVYKNMTHGKVAEKREGYESFSILNDCPINNDVITQRMYLQYINTLRQKFKKHDQDISFTDIFEDLLTADKDFSGVLPKENVFSILAKHKVHIDKTFLMPLLDLLQIHIDQNVKYKELLNLLDWKYDFPTLPKIEKLPLECQYYSTTYNTTLGNVDKVDIASIPTAGISYANVDKVTAYSLIVPNIFTRHGLSPTDLSKLRSKEEIKNIFEAIGIQFPNDSFELLWKEALKKSGTDNISVETFRNVLDKNDDLIKKENN